jgi:hypothetical protein
VFALAILPTVGAIGPHSPSPQRRTISYAATTVARRRFDAMQANETVIGHPPKAGPASPIRIIDSQYERSILTANFQSRSGGD